MVRMTNQQTDVLIVGFGPVGATIANLLGTYGVRALVVDKATAIFMAPRAIALDNEALRILQLAGLSEDAFERIAIPYVCMHSPYFGEFARINSGGDLDGHPKLVTFFEPDLERALRERVPCMRRSHGARCRAGRLRAGPRAGDCARVRRPWRCLDGNRALSHRCRRCRVRACAR